MSVRLDAALGNSVWFGRFINYLERRHRAAEFSFFSFEWYPFDEVCLPTPPQVAMTARRLIQSIDAFRKHGLKPDIPLVISEYGYSAFASQAEVDIAGALFNADTVGAFFHMGGSKAYLYGYEPNNLERNFPCTSGNNMLFLRDRNYAIKYRTATYYGAKLINQEWLDPVGGAHEMFATITSGKRGLSDPLVAAYAVKRPDQYWSIMLVNRDPRNARNVDIQFRFTRGNRQKNFKGGSSISTHFPANNINGIRI